MDLWESSHHPGSQDLEAHTRSTSLPRRTKRWVVGGSPPLTRLRTSTHLTTDRNLTATRSVPDALDFSASPQTGQWTLIKSRRTRNCPLPRRTAWLMILWTQLRRQKRSQRKSWRRVPPNEPTTREITSPTGGRGLGHPLRILRDPFTYGLGPFQMAPFGLAGIWSIWRDHTFDSLDLDITCQQARVAQTGTPITEQKDAFAAEGRCLCCVFIRRTFLVTCWHFLLLGGLLESRNMSAMYTWAKCLHFGSSELDLSDQCERTHPPLPGSGMAAEPPAKPPKEIPEALREDVDKLHRSVQVLLISKQIPWIVQAQMARDGYTTMEDLACRWTTADLARTQSPTDLKFKDGENGFDQQGSNFTAMRMYQAVMQAKNMFQAGMATGTATAGPVGSLRSNLDALCDRVAMEKDWINQTGTPKPRLEFQGSDAFLKKQFKYCSKGEIGYFAPKHIVSALPEEGERPTKSHRKFTVDGFEKEEEEEERCTRSSVTTSSCVCWPSHSSNSLIWARVTSMNGMTGSMALRSQEGNLLPLRWPCCGQSGTHGDRSVNWWPMEPLSKGLWNKWERTSYSGPVRSMNASCSSNSVSPETPKGKEKEKARGRPRLAKVSTRTTSNHPPVATRAEVRTKGPPREDAPWVAGQLTGRSNPQREFPIAGISIWSILARAIVTDPMPAQSESMVGPAMGITPLTSAPTKASLEPSRDLELTAHRDRRAVREWRASQGSDRRDPRTGTDLCAGNSNQTVFRTSTKTYQTGGVGSSKSDPAKFLQSFTNTGGTSPNDWGSRNPTNHGPGSPDLVSLDRFRAGTTPTEIAMGIAGCPTDVWETRTAPTLCRPVRWKEPRLYFGSCTSRSQEPPSCFRYSERAWTWHPWGSALWSTLHPCVEWGSSRSRGWSKLSDLEYSEMVSKTRSSNPGAWPERTRLLGPAGAAAPWESGHWQWQLAAPSTDGYITHHPDEI